MHRREQLEQWVEAHADLCKEMLDGVRAAEPELLVDWFGARALLQCSELPLVGESGIPIYRPGRGAHLDGPALIAGLLDGETSVEPPSIHVPEGEAEEWVLSWLKRVAALSALPEERGSAQRAVLSALTLALELHPERYLEASEIGLEWRLVLHDSSLVTDLTELLASAMERSVSQPSAGYVRELVQRVRLRAEPGA